MQQQEKRAQGDRPDTSLRESKAMEQRIKEIVGINLLCYFRLLIRDPWQTFIPPDENTFWDTYHNDFLFQRVVDNSVYWIMQETGAEKG